MLPFHLQFCLEILFYIDKASNKKRNVCAFKNIGIVTG